MLECDSHWLDVFLCGWESKGSCYIPQEWTIMPQKVCVTRATYLGREKEDGKRGEKLGIEKGYCLGCWGPWRWGPELSEVSARVELGPFTW